MSINEEEILSELEKTSRKYSDILEEINKLFRQEVRRLGVRKNVVPTKYILPKDYITRLREDHLFEVTWKRKLLWRYLKDNDEQVGRWVKIETFPNIGGVPVEEGPELKVEVIKIPRRKRRKANVRQSA